MGSSTPAQAPSIKMDVRENPDAFQVHAELPGVKKEDIHVTIDGNLVSISAEVKQEKEVKDGERVLRSERYFGKVSRSFQLAQDIDDSKAVAVQRGRPGTDAAETGGHRQQAAGDRRRPRERRGHPTAPGAGAFRAGGRPARP